jgi:hypothetical protein
MGKESSVSTLEHHSLDDVAKELARGSVSRRQALKLIAASLVGAGLALIPGVASAAPPAHAPPGRPLDKPEQGGYGAGGRFTQGGPLNDTCAGTFACDTDSDCGGGCGCNCFNSAAGFFFCC